MNRRSSLKKLLLTTTGLVVLPAWARDWSPAELSFIPQFSPTEQSLLATVADTIIPKGDAIGALDVGVAVFLQKLFADCYDLPVQENIKFQLNSLHQNALQGFNTPFIDCDQFQREILLLAMATSEDQNEKDFFELLKSETIRGFRTSREVMRKYYKYIVAPGHFHGCVEVDVTV